MFKRWFKNKDKAKEKNDNNRVYVPTVQLSLHKTSKGEITSILLCDDRRIDPVYVETFIDHALRNSLQNIHITTHNRTSINNHRMKMYSFNMNVELILDNHNILVVNINYINEYRHGEGNDNYMLLKDLGEQLLIIIEDNARVSILDLFRQVCYAALEYIND